MPFNGKLFLPSRTSGWISVLFYIVAALASNYGTPAIVHTTVVLYFFCLILSADVVDPYKRHKQEYIGFWEKYTKVSIGFGVMIMISQIATSFGVFEDSTQQNITWTAMALPGIAAAIAWLWELGKLPTGFSNVTGWAMLCWYAVGVVIAFVKNRIPGMWPNVLEIVTLAAMICGAAVWLMTAARKQGFMGHATPALLGGLALACIADSVLRDNELVMVDEYMWLGMIVLLVVLIAYSAADYYIFRRRPQIIYISKED